MTHVERESTTGAPYKTCKPCYLGVDYSISIYSIVYFEVLIFIMPIFVFKIQLVCSKWVLSVGLFYLSRLFEKGFLSKVNKR